jgi:hypothetical protein
MFAKVLSLLGALVITGATVLVTAEPAHATPSGGYHRQVAAVRGYHHGGHYGRYYGGYRQYRPYYGGYRYPYRPYYGGYRYPYRPYYGGYRYPYRPYYGYDPNYYLRR